MKYPIAVALAIAVCLLACAQEAPATSPVAAHSAGAMAAPKAYVRIVVQFRNPSAIDARAFVQRLQAAGHPSVHYIGAVSGDTHVYRLQHAPGQSLQQVLQRLHTMPEIADARLDDKIKAPCECGKTVP